MHRWDGDYLVDMATELGPSSPYSVGNVEDFRFYLNRLGVFTTNADKPQLISNPVQRQIYNDAQTGILGSQFDTAPASVYRYDWLCSIGTVEDDFTEINQPNAILKYDYQKNEFSNYKFYNFPTAYHSYKDTSGVQQLIFGDATGQCYQYGGTAKTDNGFPIDLNMVMLLHGNMPHVSKDFEYLEVFTNPGCQAKVQFAVINTVPTVRGWYNSGPTVWKELGDLTSGYTLFRFPPEARGKLMYLKFYESSTNAKFSLYSINYIFKPVPISI
jgi:hypothetical protein